MNAALNSSTMEKCDICGSHVEDLEKHIAENTDNHPKWCLKLKKKLDRSLFIANIPEKVTTEEISSYFSKFAPVDSVVKKGINTFVELKDKKACDKVLSHKDHSLGGKHLQVLRRRMPFIASHLNARAARRNAAAEKDFMESNLSRALESLREIKEVEVQMLVLESRLQLSDNDQFERDRFIYELEQILRQYIPGVSLVLFGSSQTGLSLIGSDMDLMLNHMYHDVPKLNAKHKGSPFLPYQCKKLLAPHGGVLSSSTVLAMSSSDQVSFFTALLRDACTHIIDRILPIPNARVPIIKCHHKWAGFDIDLSLGTNQLALYNTHLIQVLLKLDSRVRPLVYTLKIWARQTNVCGPSKGGLTSYALMMLIYTYLQNTDPPILPSLDELSTICDASQRQSVGGWDVSFCTDIGLIQQSLLVNQNDQSLPMLLRGFFYFFANVNLLRTVLCPRTGSLTPAINFTQEGKGFPTLKVKDLTIQDPFELDRNIAQNVNTHGAGHISNTIIQAAKDFETHHMTCSLSTLIPLQPQPIIQNPAPFLMYREWDLRDWLTAGQSSHTIISHWYKNIIHKVEDILKILGISYIIHHDYMVKNNQIEMSPEHQVGSRTKDHISRSVYGPSMRHINHMDPSKAVQFVFDKKTYINATRPMLFQLCEDTHEVTDFWCETTYELWKNRKVVRAEIPASLLDSLSVLDKEWFVSHMLAGSAQTSTTHTFHIHVERYTFGHMINVNLAISGLGDSRESQIVPFLKPYLQKLLKSVFVSKTSS